MDSVAPARPKVIGVGASAGGLSPLLEVFSGIDATVNAAFVVVQHLSRDHRSLMAELLGRRTALNVQVIEDGAIVEPGFCYVMPPGTEVRLEGQRLQLDTHITRTLRPIDTFFESLVETLDSEAIGIVLSGTGNDGTAGAVAIERAGGKVIVQRPTSAEFGGMPESVIASGVAQYVCEPREITDLLGQLLKFERDSVPALEPWLPGLARIVRARSGVDLLEYKESTVRRRIGQRLAAVGASDPPAYLNYVREHETEADVLLDSMLIDVTGFFRDPDVFDAVATLALPSLLDTIEPDRELRIWCAGCADGSEAYSLAILVDEALKQRGDGRSFKVFATDASRRALEVAGNGVFDGAALEKMSPTRRSTYFSPHGAGFKVKESLRRRIVFARHNLQRDPPFTRVDLLSCRNVLIYFRRELQDRLLSVFQFSLRPGGYLLLGNSESVSGRDDAFDAVGRGRDKLFRRREARAFFEQRPFAVTPTPTSVRSAPKRRLADFASRTLLDEFAPPSVVVGPTGDIAHVFGEVGPFLSLPTGAMTTNIAQLGKGPLGAIASTVVAKALRTKSEVSYSGVELFGTPSTVRVVARVLHGTEHVLLSFDTGPTDVARLGDDVPPPNVDLHRELAYTRENLQTTIEQLQASNEELQAVNEEMVASNEELQATNEELHATNEELQTVSAERQERIDELLQLNDDVANMLAGAEFGTVFLDDSLRIRKFSGLASAFTQLLPGDVGRPIGHFSTALDDVDLEAMAKAALATGVAQEQDTRSTTTPGSAILVRAMPYQSESTQRGVVFSFVNVSRLKQAEQRLQEVLDSLPQHVAVVDGTGTIAMVNDAWVDFGRRQGGHSNVGVNYLEVVDADPDARAIAAGIRNVLSGRQRSYSAEYPCETPETSFRFLLQVTPLGEGGRGAVVSHVDITARVRSELQLRRVRAQFEDLFAHGSTPVLVLAPESGRILRANPSAAALLGRPIEMLEAAPLEMVVSGSRMPAWIEAIEGTRSAAVSTVLEVATAELEMHNVAVNLRRVQEGGESVVIAELSHGHPGTPRDGARVPQSSERSQRLEALGTLAGGVAHEMNNVLAGIMGIVETISADSTMPDLLRGDLVDILAACRRGRDVTRNLLGFARADPVLETVTLSDVVDEVAALARRAAPPNVVVEVDAELGLVVKAGRSQLAQALLNLCLNGLDAMSGDGALRIVLRHHDEPGRSEVRIAVSDDGAGMTSRVQARAFEPFFTTKVRGEGTGLGLPMVHGVAASLGGRVELRSVVGEGTRVTMVLPYRRADRELAPAEARRVVTPRRILLVDDDDLVRGAVASSLRRSGMHVTEAADGESALRLVDSEEFAVVLLDVMMPGMDGFEVLRRIRHDRPELPVILQSGFPDATPTDITDLGPTQFVHKPATAAELLDRIADASP